MMISLRDVIIFLAGAQAFHTISHIAIGYLHILPIKIFGINWTQQLNLFAIIINAVITILLLWWVSKL